MAGVEFSVVFARATNGLQMLEVLIELKNLLAAITIYDVDIAIGGNSNIGGVCKIPLDCFRAFLCYITDLEQDLTVHVGLIDAGA